MGVYGPKLGIYTFKVGYMVNTEGSFWCLSKSEVE